MPSVSSDPPRRHTLDVDFVVNCYERTYRTVLAPGFVRRLADMQRYPFTRVVVLVNNVEDRGQASRMAAASGADAWFHVADHLDAARRACRFPRRALRTLGHYSDCVLVAVTLDGPEWLVYWDADVVLEEPRDWVGPAIDLMERDPRVLVAGPDTWLRLAEQESIEAAGPFRLGYGFSDLAFACRRRDLAAPIYRKVAPASWRYPLAPWQAVVEQRIDAYMRRRGRLRATFLDAVARHEGDVGISYPPHTLRSRARKGLQSRGGRLAARLGPHPALRAWR